MRRAEKQGWVEPPATIFSRSLYEKVSNLLGTLFLSATVAAAGPKPQSGKILSHTSVTCGARNQNRTSTCCASSMSSAPAPPTTPFVSQASDQTLFSINTAIEFKLDKNKMKFKVDGKSFEFIVVSQAAASSPAAAPASSAPNHH
jgi:hypothetical protein